MNHVVDVRRGEIFEPELLNSSERNLGMNRSGTSNMGKQSTMRSSKKA